jgi:hypothetical protein
MKRKILSLSVLTILLSAVGFSQNIESTNQNEDSLIAAFQEFDEVCIPLNYKEMYRRHLRYARRVYPMALRAAELLDSVYLAVEAEPNKRKKKQITKNAHKEFKAQFKHSIKDLYTSEGILLCKLIYRETGLTVAEIMSENSNFVQVGVYKGLAGYFDQDLDATYDPVCEDFVTECVINDFKNGKRYFSDKVKILDKQAYKERHKKNKS